MSSNNAINAPLPFTVGDGGTGNTTFTAYSVICAGTTSTGTFQNVSGLGTSGYVLTSNGASALPTWQAASGGGGNTSFTRYVTTGIDGKSTGATLLFTWSSASTNFYPFNLVLIITTLTGSGASPLITVGSNASTYNNIQSGNTYFGTSTTAALTNNSIADLGSDSIVVTNGTSVYLNVSVAATYTTFAFTSIIYGDVF